MDNEKIVDLANIKRIEFGKNLLDSQNVTFKRISRS